MQHETASHALAALRAERGWSQAKLAAELGLRSKGYICDLEGGAPLSMPLAITLYRKFEMKLPPIADLSDAEIDMTEKLIARRGKAA